MNIFIDTQDMEERYGEELYKEYLVNQNKEMKDKIDKAIEYIKKQDIDLFCAVDGRKLLEILGDKEKDIEFDVLKALNTNLPDDIEMG